MRPRLIVPALSVLAVGLARPARGSPTFTTLATFAGGNGADPFAGLLVDSSGNLFGTTVGGGTNNYGTVFELSGPAHQTFTQLLAFNNSDGLGPYAALSADSAGNLYGTTSHGGEYAQGTAFELSGAAHQSVTTLASFSPTTGDMPVGSLVVAASGVLYGTTSYAGGAGYGTAFSLSPGGGPYTPNVLTAFNSATGTTPFGGLTRDSAGNLYGTTYNGGANGSGTAYEIPAAAPTTLTSLATLSPAAGSGPRGTLVADAAGNLYGTTTAGGSAGLGTVFELSGPTHQTLTTLATLDASTGYSPYDGLAIDAAGNLFGTAYSGGANGGGTVFELSSPAHQTLTVLSDLAAGSEPVGRVAADAAGNLYGTTTAGGANGSGTVFELANVGYVQPTVTVPAGVTYQFNPNLGTGIAVTSVLGLNLSAGALAVVPAVLNFHSRQLLVVGSGGFPEPRSSGNAFGRLNLTNNDASITNIADPAYGANLAAVTADAAAGYAGGTWNGAGGIVSSAAAADPTRTTALGVIQNDQGGAPIYTAANPFDGQTPGPSDVLVKYTYYGDANLDGKVDGADYGQIDAGFLSGGALTGWYYGDFNYDGKVNASDYTLIDNAFNRQAGNLSAAVAASTAEVAPVPEPAAISLLTAVGVGLFGRRRRVAAGR